MKIPSNVTVIGNAAFVNDTALTGTLTIGNSVQTIGDSAFSGCKFTGKLTIPDSVISIGDNAFTNNKFSEISLGRNLEKIGGSAFNTSGTYTGQLNIPDSVKEIGKSAFNGMGFTSIRLGKSVSSIADTAFQNCTSIHSLDISSIGSADYGTNVFKSLKNPNTIYVNSEEQKNRLPIKSRRIVLYSLSRMVEFLQKIPHLKKVSWLLPKRPVTPLPAGMIMPD